MLYDIIPLQLQSLLLMYDFTQGSIRKFLDRVNQTSCKNGFCCTENSPLKDEEFLSAWQGAQDSAAHTAVTVNVMKRAAS